MIEKLHKMQKEIYSTIPCLNYGGCIHFAWFLSKRLKKLNIKHFLYYHLHESYPHNISNILQYGIHHVTVYIPSIGFIDGYKTVSFKDRKNYYKYNRRAKISIDTVRNLDIWNSMYDTKHNVLLEKIIKRHINGNN